MSEIVRCTCGETRVENSLCDACGLPPGIGEGTPIDYRDTLVIKDLQRQLAEKNAELKDAYKSRLFLKGDNDKLKRQLAEARAQIEAMKNCFNCKHEAHCLLGADYYCEENPEGKLNAWQLKGDRK